MTHFLNLLSFLVELIIGRDASKKTSRGLTVRVTLLVVLLGCSLLANYQITKALYHSSAKYIAVQEKLANYETVLQHNTNLLVQIEALERVVDAFTPGAYQPRQEVGPADRPRRAPANPAVKQPVLPPPRQDDPKTATVPQSLVQ